MADYPGLEHDASPSGAATVKFSRSSFTLPPGQATILLLSFTPPTGVDDSRLPVFSGQISITGGPVPLKITYMGAATKMRDLKMISNRPTAFNTASPALLQGVYASPAREGQVFKFSATSNTRDFPSIMFNLLTGTRAMVMDLVAADANLGFQPTFTKRDAEEGEEQTAEAEEEEESLEDDLVTSPFIEIGSDMAGSSSDLLLTPHNDLARRSARRSRHSARASANTQEKLRAALKLWCQYTNFQGRGCTAKPAANTNTFKQVPIKGNIFTWSDVSRK